MHLLYSIEKKDNRFCKKTRITKNSVDLRENGKGKKEIAPAYLG